MTGQEKRPTNTQESEAGGLRVAASAAQRVSLCFICCNKLAGDADCAVELLFCSAVSLFFFRCFVLVSCMIPTAEREKISYVTRRRGAMYGKPNR